MWSGASLAACRWALLNVSREAGDVEQSEVRGRDELAAFHGNELEGLSKAHS
jgi:hypothetical protein